jgi:WD40 repeat protein
MIGTDASLRLWDVLTGREVCPPVQFPGVERPLWFSPDGRFVVAATSLNQAGGARETRVLEVATGRLALPPLKQACWWASFSADGSRLAVSSGPDARVWDLATGQEVGPPLPGSWESITWNRIALSADGRRVVTAASIGPAQVWDVVTGKEVCPPLWPKGEVRHVAFGPDAHQVVTAASDGSAQVWEFATAAARPILPPLQHALTVDWVAFSVDGRLVFTRSADGTARAWDARTGEPVTPPFPHGMRTPPFSPDGRTFVTMGHGAVLVRDLRPDDRPVADLESLAGLFSASRLDEHGILVPCESPTLLDTWQKLRARYPEDF